MYTCIYYIDSLQDARRILFRCVYAVSYFVALVNENPLRIAQFHPNTAKVFHDDLCMFDEVCNNGERTSSE